MNFIAKAFRIHFRRFPLINVRGGGEEERDKELLKMMFVILL